MGLLAPSVRWVVERDRFGLDVLMQVAAESYGFRSAHCALGAGLCNSRSLLESQCMDAENRCSWQGGR